MSVRFPDKMKFMTTTLGISPTQYCKVAAFVFSLLFYLPRGHKNAKSWHVWASKLFSCKAALAVATKLYLELPI